MNKGPYYVCEKIKIFWKEAGKAVEYVITPEIEYRVSVGYRCMEGNLVSFFDERAKEGFDKL